MLSNRFSVLAQLDEYDKLLPIIPPKSVREIEKPKVILNLTDAAHSCSYSSEKYPVGHPYRIFNWTNATDPKPVRPPYAICRQWQFVRYGKSNPENLSNEYYTYCIRTNCTPYSIWRMDGYFNRGGRWSFNRYGISKTLLYDGTCIYIGGAHEDFYDNDHFIYNDVIVLRPTGEVIVYGYPRAIFPPIDYHSATVVQEETYDCINIGHIDIIKHIFDKQLNYMKTRYYRLHLSDFRIERLYLR